MMNKELLAPLSGFRDQLGSRKYQIAEYLRSLFEQYGYIELETPILEKQEVLLNRYGAEAQKLLYLFEDNGKRKVGLRYDLTLPLARFVAANNQKLVFPFKRYEIGAVFRAEKPQRGRMRQITQADIDIVGSDNQDCVSELLEIVAQVNDRYNLDLICYLNDRQILNKLFEELEIDQENRRKLMILLDRKDKISHQEFQERLDKTGLSPLQKRNFLAVFFREEGAAGVEEIADSLAMKRLNDIMAAFQGKLTVIFNCAMVRGLDYYTGLIIECVSRKNPSLGSLIAGGEYNDLIMGLGGKKLNALGLSFGLDRLAEITDAKESAPLFITNTASLKTEITSWAQKLRKKGRPVEVYPDSGASLAVQLKYANRRKFEKVLITLEDEWKEGKVVEKTLSTGQQKSKKRSDYEL